MSRLSFKSTAAAEAAETGSTVYDVWDPFFTKPVTMIVCAPRGSGKSVLMSDVMQKNRSFFDDVFVFAGSEAVYDDYVNILPSSRLTRGYTEETMLQVMDTCKRTTAIMKTHCTERGRDWQVALVLDDLGFAASIFKSTAHLETWMNSRHFKLSLFLCLQFVTSIPPIIRAQADIVVALRESIRANVKRLHDYFFGVFPTIKEFNKVLAKATENFGALVVNNRARSSMLSKAVFTYRAQEHATPERLCCERVWKIDQAVRLQKRLVALQKEVQQQEMISRGGLAV